MQNSTNQSLYFHIVCTPTVLTQCITERYPRWIWVCAGEELIDLLTTKKTVGHLPVCESTIHLLLAGRVWAPLPVARELVKCWHTSCIMWQWSDECFLAMCSTLSSVCAGKDFNQPSVLKRPSVFNGTSVTMTVSHRNTGTKEGL